MNRIGVVADSHVGEYLDTLPDGLTAALADCTLILHAGDISRAWVLDELRRIAPVVAVQGDHDRFGDLHLPRATTVTVDGVRVGLTHGRRRYALELAVTLATVLSGGRLRWDGGLHRSLLRRVAPVDVLVYGHWHTPAHVMVDGTLVFCPGAVCPWGSLEGGAPPRPGLRGLPDRAVRRFRQLQGAEAMRPAVGVLEIDAGAVTARRVPID